MKTIISNEFKSYIRDPFVLVVLVLFPLVMIYLLGNLVEQVQVADQTIGTIQIAYTSEELKLEQLFDNESLLFEELPKEEALRQLKLGKVVGYLNLSDATYSIYEGTSVIYNNVIKSLANGLLLQQEVYQTIQKNNVASIPNISVVAREYTEKKELEANMSMMDYYVIAMTIMTAMFSCLASSMTFTEERKNRTMNRLITSPMNKSKIFFAKCIGQLPFAMVQVGIILIFSKIFYETQYASSLHGNLILFVMLTLTAVVADVVGVIVSLIFQRSMAVVLFFVVWVMLLFSGCFAKAMTLEPLCNYLLPYQIRMAAFDLNLFGNVKPALCIIAFEIVLLVIMIFLGGFIFQKKEEERA